MYDTTLLNHIVEEGRLDQAQAALPQTVREFVYVFGIRAAGADRFLDLFGDRVDR